MVGKIPAIILTNSEFEATNNDYIPMKAKWPVIPSTILHIVDVITGKELSDIELITGEDQIIYDHPYGERYNIIYKSTQSPIELNDTISPKEYVELLNNDWPCNRKYFVRKPGYAWSKVEVDFISGGEYLVKLKKGGSIEITVQDYQKGYKVMLGISEKGKIGDIIRREISENGIHNIDSIPVGKYTVYAELGEFGYANIIKLAEVDAIINPGQITYVNLMLKKIDTEEAIFSPICFISEIFSDFTR